MAEMPVLGALRRTVLLACLLVSIAGCQRDANEPSARPTLQPSTASAPGAPTGTPTAGTARLRPSPPPARGLPGAENAYREAISAFVKGEVDKYFSTFAPSLDCFYGRKNASLEVVRRARLSSVRSNRTRRGAYKLEISTLKARFDKEGAVVLRETGFYQRSSQPRQRHRKLIRMRKIEGVASMS